MFCYSAMHFSRREAYVMRTTQHDVLPNVVPPPSYQGNSEFQPLVYIVHPPRDVQPAEPLVMDSIDDDREEPYWTPEKQQRALYIVGLVISLLASPLLVPLIPAYYLGRRLNKSLKRGDLDCREDREMIRTAIVDIKQWLPLATIARRYDFDTVKKYDLLKKFCPENCSDAIKQQAYIGFQQLQQSYKEIKHRSKNFDITNVERRFREATEDAISSYKWQKAHIIVYHVLTVLEGVLLFMATVQAARENRPVAAAVYGGIAAHHAASHTVDVAEDSTTWDKLDEEYARKIEPWNIWRSQRLRHISEAYEGAKNNLHQYFLDHKIHIANACNSNSPNVLSMGSEKLISPRPLFFTIEQEGDDEQFPICNISFDRLTTTDACSLPCGHTFNREPIEEWLTRAHNCPVCRKDSAAEQLSNILESDLHATVPQQFWAKPKIAAEIFEKLTSLTLFIFCRYKTAKIISNYW